LAIAFRDRDITLFKSKEVALTWITHTNSGCRLSAKLAAGFAISALLAVGTFAVPANARDHDDGDRRGWSGGYYAAPPVVYGSTYGGGYYGSPYYAPPVVYGPGVGVNLPGVSIGIR
jgi:uncharacterized membrane protein